METSVAECIPQLFGNSQYPSWTVGSLAIGAGMPDLLIISYRPLVFALANTNLKETQILAYLRAVGRARMETIARRLHSTEKLVNRSLYSLVDAKAVEVSADTFFLPPLWREILPDIVAIEVKVSNWQRAVAQAARNRIFAHRSFVALPEGVAMRVRHDPLLRQLGIGLMSVRDASSVHVVRRPRRHRPAVWTYYYQLARLLATRRRGTDNAFHGAVGGC
jgi:hypothetical protein